MPPSRRIPLYRNAVHDDDARRVRNAVCKINYYGKPFDFYQPYNNHTHTSSSTGTGFVLDDFPADDEGVFVVTAYHVVDGATQLHVEFSHLSRTKRTKPLASLVVAYNRHMDVALLKVPMAAEMVADVSSLARGDSDAVVPSVAVVAAGFALAHGYQMTQGTVSGRTLNRIQVDCAINGGNSGGPLIDEATGHVLGVVVSGYAGADVQNVNFITPIEETCRCLRALQESGDMAAPRLSFNATFLPGSQHLSYGKCPGGAFVSQVHPDSALYALGMRCKDVLCEMDGRVVDFFGKVEVPWWSVDPLEVETLLERRREGDTIEVVFWSRLRKELVRGPVAVERERNVYCDVDSNTTPVEYSCRGGLVVQPLLKNHYRLAHHYRVMLGQPQVRERSILVITSMRSETPFKTMRTLGEGDMIGSVNDAPVRTIEEYRRAWEAWDRGDAPIVTLQVLKGHVAVATRADVARAEEETRRETGLETL